MRFLFPHYLHQQRMSEIQSHWKQQEFHHQQHSHVTHCWIHQQLEQSLSAARRRATSLEQEPTTVQLKHSIGEEQKRKANQSRQLSPCTLTGVYHLSMLSIHLLPASPMDMSQVATVLQARREMLQ